MAETVYTDGASTAGVQMRRKKYRVALEFEKDLPDEALRSAV